VRMVDTGVRRVSRFTFDGMIVFSRLERREE
jgi:hypothetical protein